MPHPRSSNNISQGLLHKFQFIHHANKDGSSTKAQCSISLRFLASSGLVFNVIKELMLNGKVAVSMLVYSQDAHLFPPQLFSF